MPVKWALINQTTKPTTSGLMITDAHLTIIAAVCESQLNADYAQECGEVEALVRVSNGSDLVAGEKPYYFVDTLPDAPGASAYHVPGAAYCAVTTCADAYGPGGVSVDASHEMLEDAGNPGCNMSVDDGAGKEHERERCDAVEAQTYGITHPSGQVVQVSNFLLDSWQTPGAAAPYTFMTKHGLAGGVDPKGPFETATTDNQGNYQLEFPSSASQMAAVFGREAPPTVATFMRGTPRKVAKVMHWTSRASRIVAAKSAHVHASTPGRYEGREAQENITS
jgi:hypothetical protein